MKSVMTFFSVVLLVFGSGLFLFQQTHAQKALSHPYQDAWPDTDFSKSTVDLSEVISGGPPKDGIPSIDSPDFDGVFEAARWLAAKEPVIVVRINEAVRAYPLQIMLYHEIVNDDIDGTPVAVTFCPLCNASIVFDRAFENRVLDFGTTGLLRLSDMVMYDRQTESWWQQILGEGIVGEFSGKTLRQLPSQIISFEQLMSESPEALVLNRNTGHRRPYGRNPYYGYDNVEQNPFLFTGKIDPRLRPMERVVSVDIGGEQKIYPFSVLRQQRVINDTVGGEPIVILTHGDLYSVLDQSHITASRTLPSVSVWSRRVGETERTFSPEAGVAAQDRVGGQWSILGEQLNGELSLTPIVHGQHFAFAWLAFNPGVEIYLSD